MSISSKRPQRPPQRTDTPNISPPTGRKALYALFDAIQETETVGNEENCKVIRKGGVLIAYQHLSKDKKVTVFHDKAFRTLVYSDAVDQEAILAYIHADPE
ncbi:MAG: hypothetical protein HQL90_04615 [Magnetococcales bacterium]|nr:hypothetical protein [Magnetococcales bacterium]